jgi:hypothetical protein
MPLSQRKQYEDAENYIIKTFIIGTFCVVLRVLGQCFTTCLPLMNSQNNLSYSDKSPL